MRAILYIGFSLSILFLIINYLYDNFYKGEINKYYSNLSATNLWIVVILLLNIFIFIFITSYSEYISEKLEKGGGFRGRKGLKGERGEKGLQGEKQDCPNKDCNIRCGSPNRNILDDIGNSTKIYDYLYNCNN